MKYGGSLELDPPTPKDEDNIMAALKQSDRVSSITLTITNPLLEKLSAIERPFSELEELVLLSQDSVRLALPSAFRWGTRLRSLHLTRITSFALPRLLYSSRNLVDLRLHEIEPWLFSPEVFTYVLSGMAQLRSLSLHVLTIDRNEVLMPFSKRVVLPALTRLDFRGITKYLEDLVAGIDAPRLGDIEVALLNESISDVSKLSEFVDRIEMHKSYRRADILSSEHSISVSLIQPGAPTCLKLKLFCERISDQLNSMFRICFRFSAFLFNVEDLRITSTKASDWRRLEYEQLSHIGELRGTGLFTPQGTIGTFSDDILLNIFFTFWMPLHSYGKRLYTCPEDGDSSYLHLLWASIFDSTARTGRLS
ncbi:hypothetical protein BJY52DRAFT_1215572 [Lactarius psammicola]|nr:hypothetical protein BJY52DRAFT_1215572 [Lactarius psammicola]